jgi:hypothetical protein
MRVPDKNNQETGEALLNEEKGNLFEFLVAQKLARLNGIEGAFFADLNSDLKNNLIHYEESIRKRHESLLLQLMVLADNTALELHSYLAQKKIHFVNIFLIGKISANFEQAEWHESDLILKQANGDLIPISLKLSKENSFMNTKSAGAKSFIEKYFISFNRSQEFQLELNKEIDQAFLQMAHRLYDLASLPFQGKIDERWKEKWSELPGELPEEFREIIFINYNRVATLIHNKLVCFFQEDKLKFMKALEPLCGMGDLKLIQVSCYHQQHTLKSIKIKSHENYFYDGMDVAIENSKSNMSSFDIQLGKIVLQIRVKPMNKFTTPAYKINCSIKNSKELQ